MTHVFEPHGRHFEEFTAGDTFVSAGRTITETDVVNFASLSGDFTPLHTDAEFARQSVFGQRVAHGLLVLSVTSGLMAQMGIVEGTVLAFREMSWKFSAPVFIGDTIHAQITVAECKPYPRLGGGVLTLNAQVLNQTDTLVQSGKWLLLISSKP